MQVCLGASYVQVFLFSLQSVFLCCLVSMLVCLHLQSFVFNHSSLNELSLTSTSTPFFCISTLLLAYCPLGKETTPLGGGQRVPQSWAPLIDYEDGWVSSFASSLLLSNSSFNI